MIYYGESPAEAARSKERAREQALNLGLSNRSFIASQVAADNAIAQNEYQAGVGNYFKQAQLDEQADTGDENRDLRNRQLGLQKYQIDKAYDIGNERVNSAKEIAALRAQNALGLGTEKGYKQELGNAINRIRGGVIQDIPQLLEYKDKISPDDWEGVLGELKNVQQKQQDQYDTIKQKADAANLILSNNLSFQSAKTPQEKMYALNLVEKSLPKTYKGVISDPISFQFKPSISQPSNDAVKWFTDIPEKPQLESSGTAENDPWYMQLSKGMPRPDASAIPNESQDTIRKFVQRYTAVPEPPAPEPQATANPDIPPVVPSWETDPEVIAAKKAILNGKDQRAVRERYRQRTGKELPL